MKKLFATLFTLLLISVSTAKAEYMSFQDGMANSKPFALLVYANWADDIGQVADQFEKKHDEYLEKFNFGVLDIASQDTKEFNKKFTINTNLPYVILFKDNGKITRYLQKDCILDDSCFDQRLKFFVN